MCIHVIYICPPTSPERREFETTSNKCIKPFPTPSTRRKALQPNASINKDGADSSQSFYWEHRHPQQLTTGCKWLSAFRIPTPTRSH